MVLLSSEGVSDCYCSTANKRQNLSARLKDLEPDITEKHVQGSCKETPG